MTEEKQKIWRDGGSHGMTAMTNTTIGIMTTQIISCPPSRFQSQIPGKKMFP
jgi:hypothetical protein